MAYDDSRVEEAVALCQRAPYNGQYVGLPRSLDDAAQCGLGLFQQKSLPEKVAAGIARDAQFGENNQLYLLTVGLVQQFDNLFAVVAAVGHPAEGNSRGCLYKSVVHDVLVKIYCKSRNFRSFLPICF